MIILDLQDRRPIYEQIAEKFRLLILSGAMPPGSRMPSVRNLALELSINPNTIQRAYMELEQQGLIYPVKGKGNFIADSDDIRKISRHTYFRELSDLVRKGRDMGFEEDELVYVIRDCYKEGEND
ncbi:GntR family transcriptional regulator [Blautia schinkii]|nr:GntR family transcriptional regulator [Blautia schinkii]